MKRSSDLRAAVARPGMSSIAASQTLMSIAAACASTRDIDVCPSPRRGEFAIRVNAVPSCGLTRNVRYWTASLISARS